ncbi:uncharacterized protein LOC125231335 [Leguminivora glycinivorella]|uniref:uncharacterized protein LOC125231335 n=1 Tax=Leguminivora glycinivorella TaxID=1035111 RepID=UPI00200E71C5|nr:uncharacterized protein LOC125231335 [Leguminivora glycinivorella]
MAPTCPRCQRIVHKKGYLKCYKCKRFYHVECTSRSKLFDLMTPDSKKTWSCSSCCASNVSKPHTSSTNKNLQKVVPGNKPTTCTSDGSFVSEENCNNISKNKSTKECDYENTSTPASITVSTPKCTNLSSPGSPCKEQQAILSPKLTNSELKNVTHRKKMPVNLSPINSNEIEQATFYTSPVQDDMNTSKYRINIPTENSFDILSEEEDVQSSSRISESQCDMNRSVPELRLNRSHELKQMKQTITALKEKLESADREIENLLAENNTLSKKLADQELKIEKLRHICKSTSSKRNKKKIHRNNTVSKTNLDFSTDTEEQLSNLKVPEQLSPSTPSMAHSRHSPPNIDYTESKKPQTPEVINTSEKLLPPIENPTRHPQDSDDKNCRTTIPNTNKNKICMLSTNKNNRVYQLADHLLGAEFEICHYLYPGAGTRQMLENLDHKLLNFTKKDYCLIFIGEEEFNVTQNYVDVILNIRNNLVSLKYTNIIICYPTFKLNIYSNMYNSRLETFNYLLYNDNSEYEYAYLLDSNQYLNKLKPM